MQPTGNDLEAENLAKAIRQKESGGDFNVVGDAGTSHGAYQFQPATWKQYSKEILGDENAQMTPQNQNAVAYGKIKSWKDQGKNAAEIAAMWNAGENIGDKWKTNKGKTTINGKVISYDTPQYVKDVTDIYQKFKSGVGSAISSVTDTAQASTGDTQTPPKRGFLSSLAHGIIEPVATTLARPIQAGAELLGASADSVNSVTKSIAGDYVAPVPQNATDVVKDVGRGAQTVAMGLPVNGIGAAVKAGVVAGAGSGLEDSGTLGGTAKGAAVGAGAGLIGGGVSKIFEKLPTRLTKGALGLTDEQATKMLAEKSVGTKAGLVKQSENAVAKQGNKITAMIKEAVASGKRGSGSDAVKKTLLDFPEYNTKNGVEKMLTKIKSLIPSTTGFEDRGKIISAMDKIAKGTADLEEKNMVRQAIDMATKGGYSKLARAMNPSAGHDLAMTFANNLRGEVQSWVPSTQPLFEDLAKEMGIRSALRQAEKKGAKGLISYNDIIPYLAGQGLGGLPGGVASAALIRGSKSPATQFAAAKGIQGLGKVVRPVASRAGLIPLTTKK